MSSLQCLKRVHLEVNRPDLARVSPSTEAAFEIGHAVGEIAVATYGGGEGVMVEYEPGLAAAVRTTRELLDSGGRQVVFEATLEHGGVLVREDVLIPHGDSWRVVEIKASTSVKPPHHQDCAIQAWVHRGAGYSLDAIALGHIDPGFLYRGDGDYSGLIIEQDLTEPVAALQPSVPGWVERAQRAADGPEPGVPVGQHCFTPFECPFIHHCWPMDVEYPVLGLKGARKKLGELVAAGYRDIRDVPLDALGKTQQRIADITRRGQAELDPMAGRFVRELGWPRYFLDFETVSPPIPHWPGTRPYEQLPFQYSCHIQRGPGDVDHVEFLDMSGDAPMRSLAEQLIADLGSHGPVIMYTAFEKGVIAGLVARFADLARPLEALIERLVDLHPVVRAAYYHPDMLGSWSIKAVLPTVAPDLDYQRLPGIKEGNAASAAYLQAIRPDTPAAERERIRDELLQYCRLDTWGMVRLAEFFAAH